MQGLRGCLYWVLRRILHHKTVSAALPILARYSTLLRFAPCIACFLTQNPLRKPNINSPYPVRGRRRNTCAGKNKTMVGGKRVFRLPLINYVFIAVGETIGSLKRWNRTASRRSMFVAFVLASLKFALLIFRLPLADGLKLLG